ncbi:hypothetical protein [Phocaeicola barnesiae]|uniref:exodeoxyribonuclease X C-terminal domain-containing protein n=1 Tax=Phocaeicola barnesiae TaxID=376804 RepID=UPI0025A459A4|nr:hypothetical protein [Phocaeicola barnesiae]MDM8255510.1 hypothetical protein [Phocaeicola barnesiae]
MDTPVTLEHLSPEMVEQTLDRIRSFNAGRTDAHGTYVISLATSFRPYYSLWRIFHDRQAPLFIRTLAVTFDAAVERAIVLLQNCNVILEYRDNSFFEPYYGQSDDIIPFGKYRGKRMAEIYYIEPSYILWIANKFQPSDRRYDRLVELAKLFSVVHFELTVQKRKIASVSQYVGKPGDKLKELFVTVLNVRLQVDSYKPDFYVDQNILAADRDGNRFTFPVKAAAQSLTPKALSCRSRKISQHETLHLLSAKVMSQYEIHGVRYTRLGYVKLAK